MYQQQRCALFQRQPVGWWRCTTITPSWWRSHTLVGDHRQQNCQKYRDWCRALCASTGCANWQVSGGWIVGSEEGHCRNAGTRSPSFMCVATPRALGTHDSRYAVRCNCGLMHQAMKRSATPSHFRSTPLTECRSHALQHWIAVTEPPLPLSHSLSLSCGTSRQPTQPGR